MSNIIGNLKLSLLLRITLYLVRKAKKYSPRVQQLLEQESFIFQISTTSGAGGYFDVRNGTINLHFGTHPKPDFCTVWNSPNDAFSTMTSKDETDLLRALEGGKCRMSGHFKYALWFNEVMKIARTRPDVMSVPARN
jgi:hypothetical protein